MKQKQYGLRILFVIVGVLLIGIAIGMLRLSAFGSDPFTVMNLGLSGLLSWQFGTWQLLVNCVLFLFMLRKARDLIGFGTVFNMVCVGYIADALVWFYHKGFGNIVPIAVRIVLLMIAVGVFCFGVACYMRGDMGVSPYDAVGYLIERMTNQKLLFRFARIISDVVCVIVGFLCRWKTGTVWTMIGIGTIIMAFCTGPLVTFFLEKAATPIYNYFRTQK